MCRWTEATLPTHGARAAATVGGCGPLGGARENAGTVQADSSQGQVGLYLKGFGLRRLPTLCWPGTGSGDYGTSAKRIKTQLSQFPGLTHRPASWLWFSEESPTPWGQATASSSGQPLRRNRNTYACCPRKAVLS